ncbi:MAG: alpha/beta hydrolase [Acidobacteriota bacterium]
MIRHRTRRRLGLAAAALAVGLLAMRTRLMNAILYAPSAEIVDTPASAGLSFEEVEVPTEDGERLHAWWVKTTRGPAIAHLLYCHGNGGNLGTRVAKTKLLTDAGFDVFVFDYRGYGKSTGRPFEEGTYRDARAAWKALLARDGVRPDRIVYVGESLGGAVALALAVDHPPHGLVLQSTFSSVRDEAAVHYGFIPTFIVPDAYPSIRRIGRLRCPLLIVHGDADEVVPLSQGEALFAAAPEPKLLKVFPGVNHNDFVLEAGRAYAALLQSWIADLP